MIRYLLLAICILIANLSYGQSESEQRVDILELKDGSKFVGKILYENTEYVLFYNETLDSLELDKDKIGSIQRHKLLDGPRPAPYHKESGLFAAFNFGPALSDEGLPHIDITIGNRFTKHLTAGLQFGYDFNSAGTEGLWLDYNFYNVGAYARYTFTEMRYRPFVSAFGGYGFFVEKPWITNQEGGINLEPGIGIQMATSHDIKFTLSLHQYIQPAVAETTFPDFLNNIVIQRANITLNRTVLKLGIEF